VFSRVRPEAILMSFPAIRAAGVIAALLAVESIGFSIEILPPGPTRCDDVKVLATRTFPSDCNYTVEAQRIDGAGTVELILEPRPGTDVCPPVEITKTFEVSLGRLSPGSHRVSVSWTDDEEAVEEATVSVAEGNCEGFRRGDTNQDGTIDISDPVSILGHLFLGGAAPCLDAMDTDGSMSEEITDAIYLLNYLFAGGDPPPAPFPGCGTIPDGRPSLGCESPDCDGLPIDEEGLVWMGRPDGCVQCQPCEAPSLEVVVAELETAGIDVRKSGFGFLAVCAACTCPSGRFYLVRVHETFVEALQVRGWSRWMGEEP
jgi:hypothetical protein